MRLLHTKELRLVTESDAEYKADPRYAIVSHRWMADEVDFQNLHRLKSSEDDTLAVKKVKGACKQASKDGFNWIWIDSACICKTDAVEVGRAINSMFKWYRKADMCYTYLSDVVSMHTPPPNASIFRRYRDTSATSDQEETSEWFSRGWALQELLASPNMQFFDRDWNLIGSKHELSQIIAQITNIDVSYLTGKRDFRDACIAVKMSWMANRKTTEEEDRAYSMLGIFDVSMDVIYGEGNKAFTRLEKQLLATCVDESLFAWTSPSAGLPDHRGRRIGLDKDEWGVLAPSPECFAGVGDIQIGKGKSRVSHPEMTAEGVVFPSTAGRTAASYRFMKSGLRKLGYNLVFFPLWAFWTSIIADAASTHYVVSLDCYRRTAEGLKPVLIHVRKPVTGDGRYRRARCSTLETEILSMDSSRSWYNSRMGSGFTIIQPEPDE